jgi:serine/threonine-protein kinase
MPLLTEGQTIGGTFEVEKLLGEGAFAEVYRVKHRFLGRQAMKVFKQPGMTEEVIQKMLAEAILLSHLGHPNIIRVFDANTFAHLGVDRGYFTMEYVPGGTLEDLWHSHGRSLMTATTAVELIRQVCQGLHCAHAQQPPVVHRDIKPQNIMVGYENDGLRARLSDFGLAKQANRLTLLATAAGTLAFKPPEALGNHSADSLASDIWALGVTLYRLLTDRFPYEPAGDWGWHPKSFEKKPRPPSAFNHDCDPGLDAIVARCIEVPLHRRYQSAAELLKALTDWQAQPKLPTAPKPPAMPKETPADHREQAAALRLAEEARQLASQQRLGQAADTMEEAFLLDPALRPKHEHRVILWRKGLTG